MSDHTDAKTWLAHYISENIPEDELAHYGVLGMKWGVRKDRISQGIAKRKAEAKKRQISTYSARNRINKRNRNLEITARDIRRKAKAEIRSEAKATEQKNKKDQGIAIQPATMAERVAKGSAVATVGALLATLGATAVSRITLNRSVALGAEATADVLLNLARIGGATLATSSAVAMYQEQKYNQGRV